MLKALFVFRLFTQLALNKLCYLDNGKDSEGYCKSYTVFRKGKAIVEAEGVLKEGNESNKSS